MIPRLISLLIGYLFGLFQTAFFYGKLHGIDIREHGSGNAGTTNTIRVLGTGAGLVVFAGDVCKCILAILVTYFLFGRGNGDWEYLIKLYTAAGCILGHDFPFYMNFKGGKGIAVTAGLVICFHPLFLVVGIVLFFGTFLTTHFVSLGSLLVYVGCVSMMVGMGESGLLFSTLTRNQHLELYALIFLLAVLAFFLHRANIVRLLKGTENKTYLKKKK